MKENFQLPGGSGDVLNRELIEMGRDVIRVEAKELEKLVSSVGNSFAEALREMLVCEGRVVVLGMGKSGHIGSKVAATLASTGTPAFFVHAGEAAHGDMGMLTSRDVVLAFSNSGETEELTVLVPLLRRLGTRIIAVTGNNESKLAVSADIHVLVEIEEEACPLGLAPTSSTTAALAMGDALAIVLLQSRGFTKTDFAHAHPGGSLGRRLLLRCEELMFVDDAMPSVAPDTPVAEALLEMTRTGLGFTTVMDDERRLMGIFTDGDLRRMLENDKNLRTVLVRDVMTKKCKTIPRTMLAAEALQIMNENKINALPIVDADDFLVGAISMHELLRARVF
jgi:arabinose-5-phosphate isomerase